MGSLNDSNSTTAEDNNISVIKDETSGLFIAIESIGGKRRILTQADLTVNTTLGVSPFPDTAAQIITAGGIGDTVRLEIDAVVDATSGERTLDAIDDTYTLVAGDVDDEIELRDNLITSWNAAFAAATNDPKLNARVTDKNSNNAKIQIRSTARGSFHERTGSNAVQITNTGTTSVVLNSESGLADDALLAREKSVFLAEDPESPHKLGLLQGTFQVQPGAVSNRFEIEMMDGGSGDMAVNGSGTPVDFTFPAIADFDQFITSIIIQGLDNGIKLANFLGQNSALSTGLVWANRSDDAVFTFPTIINTREIKRFSSPGGWYLDVEAGNDDAMAIKEFGQNPIPIRATGTFGTDDELKITVNDNLTSIDDLRIICIGFKKEV